MAKLERYYHATHVSIHLTEDEPVLSCVIEYKGKPWRVVEEASFIDLSSTPFGLLKLIIRFDPDEDDFRTDFLTLFIESENDIEEINMDALNVNQACDVDLFLETQHQLTKNTTIYESCTEVITIEDAELHVGDEANVFNLKGFVYKDSQIYKVETYVNKSIKSKDVTTGKAVATFQTISYKSIPNCFDAPMIVHVKSWLWNMKDTSVMVLQYLEKQNSN